MPDKHSCAPPPAPRPGQRWKCEHGEWKWNAWTEKWVRWEIPSYGLPPLRLRSRRD